MKDRFVHVLWFVFLVGYTRSCEYVAKRVVVSSEVDVLRESRAIFHVLVHWAV